MDTPARARLTPREARKFGVTLGLAFLVIAGLMAWRGHQRRALVAGALGLILLLGAAVAPMALVPVERAWMGLAGVLSRVTTPIMMSAMYFLVLTPVGWVRRRLGSPIVPAAPSPSRWQEHSANVKGRAGMERQF